jgi:hypothetical protein
MFDECRLAMVHVLTARDMCRAVCICSIYVCMDVPSICTYKLALVKVPTYRHAGSMVHRPSTRRDSTKPLMALFAGFRELTLCTHLADLVPTK